MWNIIFDRLFVFKAIILKICVSNFASQSKSVSYIFQISNDTRRKNINVGTATAEIFVCFIFIYYYH